MTIGPQLGPQVGAGCCSGAGGAAPGGTCDPALYTVAATFAGLPVVGNDAQWRSVVQSNAGQGPNNNFQRLLPQGGRLKGWSDHDLPDLDRISGWIRQDMPAVENYEIVATWGDWARNPDTGVHPNIAVYGGVIQTGNSSTPSQADLNNLNWWFVNCAPIKDQADGGTKFSLFLTVGRFSFSGSQVFIKDMQGLSLIHI